MDKERGTQKKKMFERDIDVEDIDVEGIDAAKIIGVVTEMQMQQKYIYKYEKEIQIQQKEKWTKQKEIQVDPRRKIMQQNM